MVRDIPVIGPSSPRTQTSEISINAMGKTDWHFTVNIIPLYVWSYGMRKVGQQCKRAPKKRAGFYLVVASIFLRAAANKQKEHTGKHKIRNIKKDNKES